jgi:hypothetical protein
MALVKILCQIGTTKDSPSLLQLASALIPSSPTGVELVEERSTSGLRKSTVIALDFTTMLM